MLEPLLNQLVADLEMGPLPSKGEDGMYHLHLNPELSVAVKELDSGVAFWGKLGPLPQIKREELFIFLMKANFLGQGTGGSAIALDENENFLTLSLVLPYDMNYKMFKEALEDYTNYLDYWKEELIRFKKAAEESIL